MIINSMGKTFEEEEEVDRKRTEDNRHGLFKIRDSKIKSRHMLALICHMLPSPEKDVDETRSGLPDWDHLRK